MFLFCYYEFDKNHFFKITEDSKIEFNKQVIFNINCKNSVIVIGVSTLTGRSPL